MSREFTMGIRLNYHDNDFTRGIREASRQTNSFRDSMRSAQSGAGNFTSSLGIAAIAIGGITAAVGLFKKTIGGAMQMEQTQMQISALVGDAEKGKKLFQMLNDMGLKSTFSESDFLNAGKAFLPITKDLGQLNKMLGITERLAASNPLQGMEGAAFSMREMASGDIASIADRFNIGKADLKNAGFSSAGGAMKNIEALDKVLNQYGFTSKYIEDVNKSGAAQWDMMQSNIGSAMKKSGTAAMEFLKGPLTEINKWMGSGGIESLTALISKGLAATVKAAITGGKALISFTKSVKDGFNRFKEYIPIIQTLGYSIAAFAVGLGSLKTGLMAANTVMKLLNATMLTNPVGWVLLGIGLLIGLFIKMNGGIDGSKKKLLEMWNTAKKFGQAIADIFMKSDPSKLFDMGFSLKFIQATWKVVTGARVMADKVAAAFLWVVQQAIKYWPTINAAALTTISALVNGFQKVKAAAVTYWPIIKNAVLDVWQQVKTSVLPIIKQLYTIAVGAFKSIAAVVVPLGKALGNFFKALAPTVMVVLNIIAWAVTQVLAPALMIIWKTVLSLYAAVVPVVLSIVTSIIGAVTKVLNYFAVIWPAIMKIVTFAFGVIKFWWAWVGPFVMSALSVLGSIITGGFQVIMAVVQFVWTTITSVIKIAWAVISGLIQTALGLLTGDWQMAWDGIKSIFVGIWDGIISFLGGLGSLFYDSGKAIITTLVDGIKSMAMAPVNAVKGIFGKVRDFLPFSDAKKGPLSELTYSGGAIMTTLATGVQKQQGALHEAVSNAFAGTNMAMNVSATATGAQMAPAADFSAGGTNIAPAQVQAVKPTPTSVGALAPVYNIGDINIHAAEGMDGKQLYQEFIAEFYIQAQAASAVLSSSNKAALI